ncbi:helix-turn-helix domain-containing protein [Crocosphaera sp. Alani8]|uniref:helix-turn-helix domain-containing protein n=1 Tax=Crocosphaera sp. Alani8 TaxID=3038952 RepID=UPI00313D9D7D
MRNKISQLIEQLGVTPYRFAKDTDISTNTIYSLKKNPHQFPTGEVFDKIIAKYEVSLDEIVEYYEEQKEKIA